MGRGARVPNNGVQCIRFAVAGRLDVYYQPSCPHSITHELDWATLPILFSALSMEEKAMRKRSSRGELEAHGSSTLYAPHNRHTISPQPTDQHIAAISPLAQIITGNYFTPTYFIHRIEDGFIPWEETRRTHDELLKRGISTGISVVAGGGHMFEMLVKPKDEERVWKAVLDGYKFLFSHLRMEWDGNSEPTVAQRPSQ